MNANEQILKVLAAERHVLQDLEEGSPLLAHLPKAQAAIEAYCRGDDEAMQQTLKAIPFRSPYRDLRFLLGALAAFPERIEEGRELLARIRKDSPFAGPARVVAQLLAGDKRGLKPAAREFADALAGQEATKANPQHLFATLLAEAKRREDPGVREALKALLVYYPAGKTAYRRHFPLPPVEERRLDALAAEYAEDLEAALKAWADVGSLYEQAGKRLEAAAVARHLAELASKLYGPEDAKVERMLQNALRLDPDFQGSWRQLAKWYLRVGDGKNLARLLDDALARFPDDPEMLETAAIAAIERGAIKKAARLTLKLLKLDPINQVARRRLMAATLSHVRRQVALGKWELATKELQAAAKLAGTSRELAKLRAMESVLALLRGEVDPCVGIRSPLPSPAWEFLLAAEVLCLAPERAKPYLQQLRQVLDVAALKIDKAEVASLLDLAVEAAGEGAPMTRLLKPAQAFLRRGASLEWREQELETVCERLLTLEQYQLVRDYARASRFWKRNLPALIYFDVVAKCQGAAAKLDQRDLVALEKALGVAKEAGQHRLVAQITGFLEEYNRTPMPASLPVELARPAQETDLMPKEIIAKLFETFFPSANKK